MLTPHIEITDVVLINAMGTKLGRSDGDAVEGLDEILVEESVGETDGASVGELVVVLEVRDAVGELVVGLEVGDVVGELVVGLEVGDNDGELVVEDV